MRIFFTYKRYQRTKWKQSSLKTYQKIEIILREFYGEKFSAAFRTTWEYVFYTKNPLFITVYVAMSIFGYVFGFLYGVDAFIPGPYLAYYHKYLSAVVMSIGWTLYIVCLTKDPGAVTEELLRNTKQDVFDEVLYKKDSFCKTCNISKPARSKHCTVCNMCVPHFDHHCIWLNRCVSKFNHIYFLSFVGWHALICLYGSICYLLVILGELSNDY